MSASSGTPKTSAVLGQWSKSRQALQTRLQALAPRERVMVLAAVVVVSLALLWLVLLSPALNTLKRVEKERPVLESRWQQMLALRQQAQDIKAMPRIGTEAAKKALESSIGNFGPSAQLQWAGNRATVTFKGIDAESLSQWLARVRTEANATTVQTRLTRAPGNDVRWDGFIGVEIPQP